MKTIIIFGLRRSGNHFLISTILQQYSNYVHINNVDNLSYDKYIQYKNIKKDRIRIDHKWTGFKEVDCVVISMENKKIDFDVLDQFNTLNNCYSIILLRCPYSNFSSVWKVYNKKKIRLIEIVKLWKIYAKIFIDNTNFIKVLYDEYCSNDNYVINTLKKLDIDVKEIKKDKYIQYQDSSFKQK